MAGIFSQRRIFLYTTSLSTRRWCRPPPAGVSSQVVTIFRARLEPIICIKG